MCDIWFTKTDNQNPGGYKAFMPVDITDDGIWETCGSKDQFHVVRLPGILKSDPRVQKYLDPHMADKVTNDPAEEPLMLERRRWRIRGNDLPQAVKDKAAGGRVKFKTKISTEEYDFDWKDVKGYLRDYKAGIDETQEL